MPRRCAAKVRATFNAHFRGVLYTNGVSVKFCLFSEWFSQDLNNGRAE